MHDTARIILITGTLLMMLGVMAGAFGAHALKKTLDTGMLDIYHTAVEYQFIHALGLLMAGIIFFHFPGNTWLTVTSIAFVLGIILFSGSLYVLALTGITKLGMITPIGGICFIFGWLAFAVAIFKLKA